MGSPDWLFEFGEGFDFVNEKIEKTKNLMETLSEVFGLNKVVLLTDSVVYGWFPITHTY